MRIKSVLVFEKFSLHKMHFSILVVCFLKTFVQLYRPFGSLILLNESFSVLIFMLRVCVLLGENRNNRNKVGVINSCRNICMEVYITFNLYYMLLNSKIVSPMGHISVELVVLVFPRECVK